MVILGIETSCDETAVAVIDVRGPTSRPQVRALANIVASQVKLHAKYGGVVPHLARREHEKNLVPVLRAALRKAGLFKKAKRARLLGSRFYFLDSLLEREAMLLKEVKRKILSLTPPKVDAIAVTVGPGLAPALWAGVNFARALSHLWRKPLIPVNHLEGHIVTNLLPQIRKNPKPEIPNPKQIRKSESKTRNSLELRLSDLEFPAIALLVSGGHTELVLMRRLGDYRVIGETLDDAAGEAFDKVAKMMGLGFPGGPVISRLAERGNAGAFHFPRPMLAAKNFDFSFSGLKTAVLYALRDMKTVSAAAKRDVAASFEQAAVDVLVAKTIRAAKTYEAKTVMIGGGVAANTKLRSELARRLTRDLLGVALLLPDPKLTGDNALMIALAGWFNRDVRRLRRTISAEANLRLDGKTPH